MGRLLTTALTAMLVAHADPLGLVKDLEGSVRNGRGEHVTYDDATGMPAVPAYYCPGCREQAQGMNDGVCPTCGGALSVRYDVEGTATIGYGVTDPGLVVRGVMSEEDAGALLKNRLERIGDRVDGMVRVALTEGQRDALISFAYSVGLPAFRRSTLLKKLNDGRYGEVPSEIRRWNLSGGRASPGLEVRREKEVERWEE